MKYIVTDNYEDMSQKATEIIIRQIKIKPESVICFPTGSTPLRMYEMLAEANQRGEVDLSHIYALNVDDYVGLAPENDQSYSYYLHKNLYNKCNINPSRIFPIDTMSRDMDQECKRYEKLIFELGGIDLVIDGLGENGHIGFNEPADSLVCKMHVGPVSEWSRRVNARFFNDISEVPTEAVTLGIDDMFLAKMFLIIVNGPKKADAIRRLTSDNTITTQFPVSLFKMANNTTILLDKEAVGMVNSDFFKSEDE